MTTASGPVAPGVRVPMTWDEYLAIPESVCTEYIDGAAVMSPFPSLSHSRAVALLQTAVSAVLPPGWLAVSHYGWKPAADEFGPDLIVVPADAPEERFTGIPPVVAEVLSTNRADDFVRKVQKYARAGAPQYWIVDPRDREITALELRGEIYEAYSVVDAENRSGELHIPIEAAFSVTLTYEQFFS